MYYTNYINNSLTFKVYSGIKHKLAVFYQDSRVYKGSVRIYKILLICWRGSFLNTISEEKLENNPWVINNSNVVKLVKLYYNTAIIAIFQSLRLSKIYNLSQELKEVFSRPTVKTLSITLIVAVSVNALLVIALGRGIGFWGWLIRLLCVCIGCLGLFSPASWQEMQKTSVIIKNILEKNEE